MKYIPSSNPQLFYFRHIDIWRILNKIQGKPIPDFVQ